MFSLLVFFFFRFSGKSKNTRHWIKSPFCVCYLINKSHVNYPSGKKIEMFTGTLVRAAPQVRLATRQMSVISGPPRVRISFAEKVIHGVVICGSMLVVPAWVLVNIKNYKARD
ncbi:uncharacterized protein LOC123011340 [Tribolium madens]|uniref:uncharacterized protein LOC123011340 n=1 Tax=Tribolium madens TaxID=41895 RepID=UPI001CF750D3|nr:uncharacterized protein LOC123011340 [Tribolium madens]